jgi:hypothetical protein
MPTSFRPPTQPKDEATQKSYHILRYAHDTAESLLDAFARIKGPGRGAPTDEQQDLLRAMVVFAGAGIDSMTKQLIRDALPEMVARLPAARERVERLGVRHLRRSTSEPVDDETGVLPTVNPQRLTRVLLADSPRTGMVELIVDDLTAGSLQSLEELYRIANYLGLDPKNLGDEGDLRAVFECRNRLIHEMDIDFNQPNRNRFSRRKNDMVKHANTLLEASASILRGVDDQLRRASR